MRHARAADRAPAREARDCQRIRIGSRDARLESRQRPPRVRVTKEGTMRALTPWTGLTTFKTEMDRLFDRFFEPGWAPLATPAIWEPKVDVTETKETIVVKAELPGVEQKDIAVTLEDGVLTIKGEKEEKKEEKDTRYHRVERSYGSFARVMRLPAAVEGGKTTASFKDGVVTITLPKAPGATGTTIPVKAE
jgi:HSP20 family protein